MLVDAQSWWTPNDTGETMHVHCGGDWPLYQELTGKIPIDIVVKLHHADGVIQDVKCPLSTVDLPKATHLIGLPESVLIQKTFPFVMDTAARAEDGWMLFQAQTSFADRDGFHRAARVRGSIITRNGKPANTAIDPKELSALSWFQPADTDGRGYSNASIAYRSIPLAPVSGIWRPLVRVHASTGGVRHMFVSVDPDFHNADPALREGLVLARLPNMPGNLVEMAIDTSKLAKGPHKLMVKGSDEGMFPRGTLEGALVVGFMVA